jgi:hypothetical protein
MAQAHGLPFHTLSAKTARLARPSAKPADDLPTLVPPSFPLVQACHLDRNYWAEQDWDRSMFSDNVFVGKTRQLAEKMDQSPPAP